MVFPDDFLWGVSSSGFQFEMGDPSRRALDQNSDWYVWVHDRDNRKRKIVSGDLPEDGLNFWFLYEKDNDLTATLGCNACRIGIEWSRIFPTNTRELKVDVERSDDGRISKICAEEAFMEKLEKIADNEATNHYRSVIMDLQERGIEPFICLNHFTLPLWIHDPIFARDTQFKNGRTGWLDEETIIEFWKYAAYLARKLGDLIDFWATINEPMAVAESGYLFPEIAHFPPGLRTLDGFRFSSYKRVLENIVVAHARAYDAIKEWDTVKARQNSDSSAQVGLIQNVSPMFPYNPNHDDDREASVFASHLHNLYFIEAISEGWLDENLDGLREKSEKKPYLESHLDWIGVNYYNRNVIRCGNYLLSRLGRALAGIPSVPMTISGYGNNCKPNSAAMSGRPTSDFGWEIYPEGLTDSLRLMSKYGKPLFVTENGIADSDDKLRPQFVESHLRELDKAIAEEKLNVRGYFHWALTDNYEWAEGFKMKFGLYAVDFETKARTPRKSAEVYKHIIETKKAT